MFVANLKFLLTHRIEVIVRDEGSKKFIANKSPNHLTPGDFISVSRLFNGSNQKVQIDLGYVFLIVRSHVQIRSVSIKALYCSEWEKIDFRADNCP